MKKMWLFGFLLITSSPAFTATWYTPFKKEHCTDLGVRQYAAKINAGNQDWEKACKNTAAQINGQDFTGAKRCIGTFLGLDGMWGQFDVKDNSCEARWDTPKDDGCKSRGLRQYSAILRDIPGGVNGTTACYKTPNKVANKDFAKPDRCSDQGIGGVWGEFYVPDHNCPYWGNHTRDKNKFVDNGCTGKNIRTYVARLWDVAAGEDWDKECKAKLAVVEEHPFITPTRCAGTFLGVEGIWGEFDIIDSSCKGTALSDQQRIELALAKYREIKPYVDEATASFAVYRRNVEPMRKQITANVREATQQKLFNGVSPSVQFGKTLQSIPKPQFSLNKRGMQDGGPSAPQPPRPAPIPFKTFTYGMSLDASGIGAGLTLEWGTAGSFTKKGEPLSYTTFSTTSGIAMGFEGSLTQGLWVPEHDAIDGESWGVVIGTSPIIGGNISFWFDLQDQFIGFVVIEGVGLSLEVYEVNWASTGFVVGQ
jgi:hypothetical protein